MEDNKKTKAVIFGLENAIMRESSQRRKIICLGLNPDDFQRLVEYGEHFVKRAADDNTLPTQVNYKGVTVKAYPTIFHGMLLIQFTGLGTFVNVRFDTLYYSEQWDQHTQEHYQQYLMRFTSIAANFDKNPLSPQQFLEATRRWNEEYHKAWDDWRDQGNIGVPPIVQELERLLAV